MRMAVSLLTIWIFSISVGCQANPITSESIASPVPPPSQGEITQMPSSIPTPSDSRLQNLIEKVRADLANRFGVSANEIVLVEARSVTWPDSSLGCPNPSLMYTQVVTPGYLIRLQVLERTFEIHTNKRDQIIYCDDTSALLPGTLPDR